MRLTYCRVQDISNTLWAFAALKHHPGQDLMSRAATQAILTIQRFKPQELANTLWSFATLEHDPSTQLLDAMAIQIIAKIQGFRPQAGYRSHLDHMLSTSCSRVSFEG